jgi:hypothetical protein
MMVWTEYATPNVTGTFDMLAYGNEVTNGMLGAGMLGAIWVVLFMLFNRWGMGRAMGSASFITMTLAFILRATSQIGDPVMMVFIGLTAFSFFFMMKD